MATAGEEPLLQSVDTRGRKPYGDSDVLGVLLRGENFLPRVLVMGERAVVSAAQPLAAAAGVEMIRAGGNAVDAAIAANAALTVVRPGSCGIGGDLFALVYDPRDGRVHCVNGSGRAPAGATQSRYVDMGWDEMPKRGPLAVTVPGCVDGWRHLHQRFAAREWSSLFEPAIGYARDGWPISPATHRSIARGGSSDEFSDVWKENYVSHLPAGPGGLFRTPNLAKAFEAIAREGADAFYQGEIGAELARTVQDAGGFLTPADLADHATTEEEPIRARYAGHDVYQTPPNSQGLVALIGLQVLERLGEGPLTDSEAGRIHRQLAAYLEGLRIRDAHVADPQWMTRDVEHLIDSAACAEIARGIDLNSPAIGPLDLRFGGDTTALAAADSDGWVVVLIQSLFHGMGSRVTVPGWGIVLHSRGAGFNLQEGHPNCLAPNKRPLHTLCASIVCRENEPVIGFGTEGGHLQPQVHMQVLSRMLNDGANVQEAIEAPRWCYDVEKKNVRLEGRIASEAAGELEAFGYPVQIDRAYSSMGQSHGVQVLQSGTLAGGADPRSEGYVLWL